MLRKAFTCSTYSRRVLPCVRPYSRSRNVAVMKADTSLFLWNLQSSGTETVASQQMKKATYPILTDAMQITKSGWWERNPLGGSFRLGHEGSISRKWHFHGDLESSKKAPLWRWWSEHSYRESTARDNPLNEKGLEVFKEPHGELVATGLRPGGEGAWLRIYRKGLKNEQDFGAGRGSSRLQSIAGGEGGMNRGKEA